MRMTKEQNTNKGITLIALVITIIVMLILVAVTIAMAVNGGLFDYARKAGQATNEALQDEQQLASGKIEVDGLWYNTIEDYVANEPIPTSEDFFEMVDAENGVIAIKLDESENHDGIGYYYVDPETEDEKILSEEYVVIPSEINGDPVKRLGAGMFSKATNLKTVVISEGVVAFENSVFQDCENLEKVILPSTFRWAYYWAFDGCANLRTIEYRGTVAQWNEYVADDLSFYDSPATFVQCSDGRVEL